MGRQIGYARVSTDDLHGKAPKMQPAVYRAVIEEAHKLGVPVAAHVYELADAKVEDMRAEVWKLTRVTFTGAAILLREKAAYRATSFRMAS